MVILVSSMDMTDLFIDLVEAAHGPQVCLTLSSPVLLYLAVLLALAVCVSGIGWLHALLLFLQSFLVLLGTDPVMSL